MDIKDKDKKIKTTLVNFLNNISNNESKTTKCPFCNTEISEESFPTFSVIKCKTKDCFYEIMKGL